MSQDFNSDIELDSDLIDFDEFYPDAATGQYVSHGPIALNYRYIGKIKEWARK